ncbi:MAG: outer membrane protein multidrug efflux system, partial [Acetobacteraceae bacterium]|nr:outer membrane protein multidrug efflux system [Acetobacteraceae bacterium]
MRPMTSLLATVCLAATLATTLAACTVGPYYAPPKPPDVATWNDKSARATEIMSQPPAVQRPAGQQTAVEPTASQQSRQTVSQQTNPDPRWWNSFGDPVLTELMGKA